MSRDKQIEEMAKIRPYGCEGSCKRCSKCDEWMYAERIYNAGYRKASDLEAEIADLNAIAEQYRKQFEEARTDVAREIFEEIEDVLNNIGYFDEIDFKALKNKYIGKDTNVTTKTEGEG